jgi:hypothetical protein
MKEIMKALRKYFEQLRHSYHGFKTYCLAALSAIRDLTEAIHSHNERVSELHQDIKKIEHSVGFLYRAERYQRESNGHKVNF